MEHFFGRNLSSLKFSMEIDFHIPYLEKVLVLNDRSHLTVCRVDRCLVLQMVSICPEIQNKRVLPLDHQKIPVSMLSR